MFDFWEELENNNETIDNNNKLGNRVKQYTLITRYFDNFLRFNKQLFIVDIFKITLLLGLALQYTIMKVFYDYGYSESFLILFQEYSNICSNVFQYFFNHYQDNAIKIFDIFNIIIENKHIEITNEVDKKTYYILGFSFFITIIHHILILIQFYAQKFLFSATFTYVYVPKHFLYHFLNRRKNNYFFIKLIKNQKNKNIYSSMSEIVIKNLFLIGKEEMIEKKLSLLLHPRLFIWLYDYIEISFQEEKKKEKKENSIKEINNKIEEAITTQEDNNNSTLDVLNLEALEKLDI